MSLQRRSLVTVAGFKPHGLRHATIQCDCSQPAAPQLRKPEGKQQSNSSREPEHQKSCLCMSDAASAASAAALQHRLDADRVTAASRQPLPSASAFLWSHLLCNILVPLQETVTKDKRRTGGGGGAAITWPEQLISASCVSMAAKLLPYTETEAVQGLGAPAAGNQRTRNFLHFSAQFNTNQQQNQNQNHGDGLSG